MGIAFKYPAPLTSVNAAYDGAIVVNKGDLMHLDTDDAKPAGRMADAGTEAQNQAAFAPKFLGVAIEGKLAVDAAGDISVATDAIVEASCVSAAYEVGDRVTICENAGGTAIENQKLTKTTTAANAIGYVVRRSATPTTTILVRLISRVCPNQFAIA